MLALFAPSLAHNKRPAGNQSLNAWNLMGKTRRNFRRKTMTETATVDNGVNVEALLGAREALTEAPEDAQFTWRAP